MPLGLTHYTHDPGEIALVLDCPFCGRAVAYPGRGKGGEPALAECGRCDVYFDFSDDEVYVAEAAGGERAASAAGKLRATSALAPQSSQTVRAQDPVESRP